MRPAPTVSVLTPAYNGDAYLDECIQSVLGQTFRDWELVVVDNCSTDETRAIAKRYAGRDERIRLLAPEEFVGVYGNHNRALQAMDARARYCKFLHADDWLYPECLERMVAVAERHPGVGVVSSYRLEGAVVEHSGLLPYTEEVMAGREVVRRALLGPPWVTGSPSSLLFRADLVRGAKSFFDESVWHADTDSAYQVLLQSELGFVHQVLSFTRLHAKALTSFSHQANTYLPHHGRMLIRYGKAVLGEKAYRKAMRAWLRQYSFYLTKQALKPKRHLDKRFHAFHRGEIQHLQAELGQDKAFQLGLSLCLALVKRPSAGAAHAPVAPAGATP
jgi:glycosyltransferase involved in cell wall biosynthesis